MAALFGADDQRGEAHVEADRLVEPARAFVWSLRTVAPRRLAASRAALPEGDQGRGRRHAQVHGGALRPRRRDRAHALPVRGDRRRDPQPRRALGRARHARRAARRGDPAARAHPLPRPDGRDLPRGRRRRGGPRASRGAGAGAGSTPRSSTRCWPSASDRSFWRTLEQPDVSGWEPADLLLRADDDRLDRIAEAFARVIDAKSPFTARHSERVAEIAVGIGGVLRFGAETRRDLRRAGLLHDVGKLAISNLILDKPGKLTDAGVREGQGAPGLLARDPPARAVLRHDRRARRQPPRAHRRQRVPARTAVTRRSTCRCACSRSPTSTRRSRPNAPTAPRCRSSEALEIVVARGTGPARRRSLRRARDLRRRGAPIPWPRACSRSRPNLSPACRP